MSPFGSKLSATVVTSKFEAETRAVVNRNLFRDYADDTLLDGVEFDGTTGSSGYTVFARWIAQGLVDKACGLTGGYTRDDAVKAGYSAEAPRTADGADVLDGVDVLDSGAFQSAGKPNSMIELIGGLLPALTSIGSYTFKSFSGTLIIKGKFLGGLPALTSIGISAFKSFSGTLIIKEKFPLLAAIQAPRLSAVNAKRAAASDATFTNEYNMFGFDDDGVAQQQQQQQRTLGLRCRDLVKMMWRGQRKKKEKRRRLGLGIDIINSINIDLTLNENNIDSSSLL